MLSGLLEETNQREDDLGRGDKGNSKGIDFLMEIYKEVWKVCSDRLVYGVMPEVFVRGVPNFIPSPLALTYHYRTTHLSNPESYPTMLPRPNHE